MHLDVLQLLERVGRTFFDDFSHCFVIQIPSGCIIVILPDIIDIPMCIQSFLKGDVPGRFPTADLHNIFVTCDGMAVLTKVILIFIVSLDSCQLWCSAWLLS